MTIASIPTRSGSLRGTLLLTGSIACETWGTLMLQASRGFTEPVPTVGVVVAYAATILLFSRALEQGLTLGIAYGTVTGCGLLAATLSSAVLFGEPLSVTRAVGLGLILAGALALQIPRDRTPRGRA